MSIELSREGLVIWWGAMNPYTRRRHHGVAMRRSALGGWMIARWRQAAWYRFRLVYD